MLLTKCVVGGLIYFHKCFSGLKLVLRQHDITIHFLLTDSASFYQENNSIIN